MAKKSLINPDKQNIVIQIEDVENVFDVAEPLYWVDCDDSISVLSWKHTGGVFVNEGYVNTAEDNAYAAGLMLVEYGYNGVTASMGNSELSNPYITNYANIETITNQLKLIVMKPTAGNNVLPKPILIQWSDETYDLAPTSD